VVLTLSKLRYEIKTNKRTLVEGVENASVRKSEEEPQQPYLAVGEVIHVQEYCTGSQPC